MKKLLLACAFALVSTLAFAQSLPTPNVAGLKVNGTTENFPASGNLAGTTDTQTLSGKSISGSANTLTNIGNSSLTNPATTVNGQTCTLGSPCTVTGAPSGTAGGDLSGTYPNPNVAKINGTSLGALATGILKNTTATGAPSIATGADLPAMTATVGGAVPTPPNNTTTYLRGDGTFGTPTTVPGGSAGGSLSGTYPNPGVANIVPTNPITFGTSLYPSLTVGGGGGSQHYDATSAAITNTIGAKNALLGVASKNGNQWPNTYMPGIDTAGGVTTYTIAPPGSFYGSAAATRTSDDSAGNIITDVALCVEDNVSVALSSWCRYEQANIQAANLFVGHLNDESTINSHYGSDAPFTDPYNVNPSKFLVNTRLDCGDSLGGSYECSSPLQIVNNGSKYKTGIVFQSNALDTVGGTATADMIAGAPLYSLTWYGAANTPVWKIFSNTAGGSSQMILGTNELDIYFGGGGVHPISATTTSVAFGVPIAAPAGTTSAAPIVMQSGSNLTTAAAGASEFDGKAFYDTSAASSRQVRDTEQFTILSADNTAPTNVSTAQNVFPTGQGTLTVQGSTTYEFEASYYIDTTGTTSNSLGVDWAGTWTGSIAYDAIATNGTAATTPSAPLMTRGSGAATQTVTAAVAAATQRTIKLRGTLRINASGTFIPQFQYSAAPGAAPVVRAGSFFRCWPIGSNTVTSVGNWS